MRPTLRFVSVFVVVLSTVCVTDLHAKFEDIGEDMHDFTKLVQRKLTPIAMDAIVNTNVTTDCLAALTKLIRGASDKKAWALKFLTSNGMVPPGALYLGTGAVGHYGQCVSSKSPPEVSGGQPMFVGQFCSLFISLPADVLESSWNLTVENGDMPPDVKPPAPVDNEYFLMRLRFGICIPSTCRTQELAELLSYMVAKYELKTDVASCRTLADEDKRSSIYYVATWTFACLVVLVALSSTAEYLQWAKPGDVSCILSILTTNRYLFSATREKNQSLAFLQGIKSLISFWIVLGHTYLMVDHYTIYTLKETLDNMATAFAQITSTGAFFGVTTFFCISGFLLTYGLLSYTGPARPVAFIYTIIMARRYIRLMLPSGAVILFSFVLPAWVHGPTTDNQFQLYTESCKTDWWRHFTFTNNFEIQHMCLYHYWFMSVDMQIFVVMTIFALLMCRRPKFVGAILVILIMGSSIWVMNVTSRRDLPPAAIFNENWVKLSEYMSVVYLKSITHAGPFAIGMLAGYFYFKTSRVRYTMATRRVSSAVCLGVMFCLIEATLPAYLHVSIPRWIELLYAGFHRVIWSLACCWLMFLMATHNMDWLARFLSSRIFVILGRLSFGIYLVHFPLMTYYMGINTVYVQMAHSKMVRTAIGNYALSVVLAYMLHVLVEAPTIQLDSLLFKALTKSNSKPGTHLKQMNGAEHGDSRMTIIKIDTATKL